MVYGCCCFYVRSPDIFFIFFVSPLALVGFSIKFDFYGRMVQVGLGAGNVFICNLMSLRLGTTKRWYGACDTRIEKSPLDNNVSYSTSYGVQIYVVSSMQCTE